MTDLIIKEDSKGKYVEIGEKRYPYHYTEEPYNDEGDIFDMRPAARGGFAHTRYTYEIGDLKASISDDSDNQLRNAKLYVQTTEDKEHEIILIYTLSRFTGEHTLVIGTLK